MRLKVVTMLFILTVLGLILAAPVVLGPLPKQSAPRTVRLDYGVRTLRYLEVLLLAFAGSGIGAFFVLRNAKAEYQRESVRNVKALLEAAENDRKKAKANDAESV